MANYSIDVNINDGSVKNDLQVKDDLDEFKLLIDSEDIRSVGVLPILGAAALTTTNKAISISNQISGNAMYQNKINAGKNAFSLAGGTVAKIFASGVVGGALGMTVAMAGIVAEKALEYEKFKADIDKEEKKQNNLRAIVGLEATNFSRYSGQRR